MTGYTVTLACGFTLTVSVVPPSPPPSPGDGVWCPVCGFEVPVARAEPAGS